MLQDDEGLKRHAQVWKFDREHGAFAHRRVLQKAALHLHGMNPLPGNPDEVVASAPEIMETVGIAGEAVFRAKPSALADGLRGFCRAIPIEGCAGVAANP